jgi:hypothetical protein
MFRKAVVLKIVSLLVFQPTLLMAHSHHGLLKRIGRASAHAVKNTRLHK